MSKQKDVAELGQAARVERISEDPRSTIRTMQELRAKDYKISIKEGDNRDKKEIALKFSQIWEDEFSRGRHVRISGELLAADNVDANAGILSGTLVAQQTMELMRYDLAWVPEMHTDFSAEPAALNQVLATRVVLVPAVQAFDPTLNNQTGLPNGWSFVTLPQTKDVQIKLDELIGVPIRFGYDILSSTARKLFTEQAPAASYGLTKYFSNKILKLLTPGNYNAYAAINGAKVPAVYPYYSVGLGDFARSSLTKLAGILSRNEVPARNRFALFNCDYYEQLANDPSITQFYAAVQKPEIITDSSLPKMARFLLFEVPNLTENNNTANLVGFVGHKAGVAAMVRPPLT